MAPVLKIFILASVATFQWFAATLPAAGAPATLEADETGQGRAEIGFGAGLEAVLPSPVVLDSTPSMEIGSAWPGVELSPAPIARAPGVAISAVEEPSIVVGPTIEFVDPAAAERLLVERTLELEMPRPDLASDLARANETVRVLTESLAIANSEAELFKRKFSELKLRMEALGLDSADPDRAALEQRVLHAVNDLRLERERSEKLREQLMLLAEAMLPYLSASEVSNAELRAAVEAEMREAAQLAFPDAEPTPVASRDHLTSARVLSVKDEWSLVVGSLGGSQGVRIGMPFRVLRDGQEVAHVRVVDVRDRVFGAVVEPPQDGSAAEAVMVGDILQVAMQ